MKKVFNKKSVIVIALLAALGTSVLFTSCSTEKDTSSKSTGTSVNSSQETATADSTGTPSTENIIEEATKEISTESTSSVSVKISESDISVKEKIENSNDGEHVVTADGESKSYSNISVTKTGEADGDEADFYGENSALFATNGGTLDLKNVVVKTDGTHANAVFSYGEGTTVNVSDSYIETDGNCSGGIMTTGGGTMNANNLTIDTSGNSSAAIRSDRGGGTVNVTGGYYTTSGVGSPVIYSTADITVNDAVLTANTSQGIVVEGKNSVTLNNVELTADNNKKNGSHSDYYQAVMIYQSMSGDADEGLSSFDMNGGTLVNKNGDIFFVTNTATTINLSEADITNEADGIFLRAATAGWGSEGSNGGKVTLNASKQTINGDIVVDSVSALNLYLKDKSVFNGAVNTDGQDGDVYIEIESGSTWNLTGDSYITGLTCDTSSVKLNGHKLYINGELYSEGTASSGSAVDTTASSSGNSQRSSHSGNGGSEHGTPPKKPDEN